MILHAKDPHNNLLPPSYKDDAGYDLKADSKPNVIGHQLNDHYWKYIDYIEYDTNVLIAPHSLAPIVSLLFPRSSISRYNLSLANSVGVIDKGYRDTIKVRFNYLAQADDYRVIGDFLAIEPSLDRIYKRGDKIAQLIFSSPLYPEIEKVASINEQSERATGGFGSSGT